MATEGQVIELLKERGDRRSERELPDKVDREEHANLLEKHGTNPKELIGKIGF